MPLPDDLQHLIRDDEPLGPHTWLGIGGPARYFAEPTDPEELVRLVRAAHEADLPVRVLGGGSNLLVREAGVDGLVISMAAAPLSGLQTREERLIAGAGAPLSHVVTRAAGSGLGGMECLAGIPGTVGGALAGNAGAAGGEIGAVTESVEVLSSEGTTETLSGEGLQFSHRHSDLEGRILLSAVFRLTPADPRELTKRMQKMWIVRRASRPANEPRIAVPFVDPDGADASRLIEEVGLKGVRRGNVSLDSQNPAYLIAHSGASSDEVLELVDSVRDQVSRQLGIDLQLNLKIW